MKGRNAFHTAENEWMMGNDEVYPTLNGFIYHGIRKVKSDERACAWLGRVAQ